MFHMAMALLDPRPQYTYFPGMAQSPVGFTPAGVAINSAPALGWLNAEFQVADYAPGTASTTSLATGGNITASTAVTLVSSAGSGVTPSTTCTNATSGATVTTLWRIDNTPNYVSMGSGSFGIWDPANPPIGRCVSITSATGTTMSGITFTVAGYDAYGYPITQVMTGPASASTGVSTKAFKWVSSVAASATVSPSTFSVGVSDTYGLPFYCTAIGYVNAYWNNAIIAGSVTATTFTAGTAYTATTSSDVRGTINLGGMSASDGVKKLQMWMSVNPSNLTVSGLFGVSPL